LTVREVRELKMETLTYEFNSDSLFVIRKSWTTQSLDITVDTVYTQPFELKDRHIQDILIHISESSAVKDRYADPRWLDGTTWYYTSLQNDVEKRTVSLTNCNTPDFERLNLLLNEKILKSKYRIKNKH
jgi:hypothetical protein